MYLNEKSKQEAFRNGQNEMGPPPSKGRGLKAGYWILCAGVLIASGQGIYYLWAGEWVPVSLLMPLEWLGTMNPDVRYSIIGDASSFYQGLHDVLSFIPLSGLLIAVGYLSIPGDE